MPYWLEKLFNRVNDKDINWYGVVHWRPPKDRAMTPWLVLKICLVFVPVTVIICFAVIWGLFQINGLHGWEKYYFAVGGSIAAGGLFILGQLMSAACWNQRAARLRKELYGEETLKDSYRDS